MRFVRLTELLELHRRIIELSGGADGVRDIGLAESALAQPHMTFGGNDLYPSLSDKAAALCFSLVLNHPFVDGNKRIGHATMEVFLLLNGFELNAEVDDAESVILNLAAGKLDRAEFNKWVNKRIVPTER